MRGWIPPTMPPTPAPSASSTTRGTGAWPSPPAPPSSSPPPSSFPSLGTCRRGTPLLWRFRFLSHVSFFSVWVFFIIEFLFYMWIFYNTSIIMTKFNIILVIASQVMFMWFFFVFFVSKTFFFQVKNIYTIPWRFPSSGIRPLWPSRSLLHGRFCYSCIFVLVFSVYVFLLFFFSRVFCLILFFCV